ncbi:hypothetical protein ABBQ38_010455 [Trebouxia sp. C0009 RCD-2024]
MLQRRSRTLLQSARTSGRFLCAASSQPTHSPIQAAVKQAEPLTAIKASRGRYQPLPGWLATLTVSGVAAGIVAANLEEVPLTGRKQLQINWLQPECKEHGTIPELRQILPLCAARPISTVSQNERLCLQGEDVLRSIYARAAFSTNMLAQQHPKLRARLSSLPERAEFLYDVDKLSASASSSFDGKACAWYDSWSTFRTNPRLCIITMSTGDLLRHSSHSSLVWVMGREFAHGIAKHRTELDSWTLVATCAVFSGLALSRIALLPAIALGCVLSTVITGVVIEIWLSQQQEHEADVIGAAIATAAQRTSCVQ